MSRMTAWFFARLSGILAGVSYATAWRMKRERVKESIRSVPVIAMPRLGAICSSPWRAPALAASNAETITAR